MNNREHQEFVFWNDHPPACIARWHILPTTGPGLSLIDYRDTAFGYCSDPNADERPCVGEYAQAQKYDLVDCFFESTLQSGKAFEQMIQECLGRRKIKAIICAVPPPIWVIPDWLLSRLEAAVVRLEIPPYGMIPWDIEIRIFRALDAIFHRIANEPDMPRHENGSLIANDFEEVLRRYFRIYGADPLASAYFLDMQTKDQQRLLEPFVAPFRKGPME